MLINFKLLLQVDHGWLLQGIFAQKSHGSFWQKHFKQSMAIVFAKQQYSMIAFSKLQCIFEWCKGPNAHIHLYVAQNKKFEHKQHS